MDHPMNTRKPESAPLTLDEYHADFESGQTELFSMELRTVAITTDGIQIHIVTVENVASFSCICPVCGKGLKTKWALKLHAKTHLQSVGNISDSAKTSCINRKAERLATVSGEINEQVDGATNDVVRESRVEAEINDGADEINSAVRNINDGAEDIISEADKCGINEGADEDDGSADDIIYGAGDIRDRTDSHDTANRHKLGNAEDDGKQAANVNSETNNVIIHTETVSNNKIVVDGVFSMGVVDGGTIGRRKRNRKAGVGGKMGRPRKYPKDAKIICNECGLVFKRRKALHDHITIHTGRKPYQCTVCGKQFRLKNFLNKHMKIHSGEKPHLCPDCGQAFSELANLNRHMVVHAGPHLCAICGMRFSQPIFLKKHRRVVHEQDKSTDPQRK